MTNGGGASSNLDQLRAKLNHLRRQSGEPSTRDIALRAQKAMSHTTVSQVLRCDKTPRWQYVEQVVQALGGDINEFRAAWVAVRNNEDPVQEPDSRGQDLLVDVARRSQTIVNELIAYLSFMQRNNPDNALKQDLNALETIAWKMRRHHGNLLILANGELGRAWREPARIADVIRAAQSEIGTYSRVEVGPLERHIAIIPSAAHHVTRIVAELLDNALSFSPPEMPVRVEARTSGTDVVLRVEDGGIGIPPAAAAEFAERMTERADARLSSRMMGLAVVARLAAHHAVHVELGPNGSQGTVATVTLPAAIVLRLPPAQAETPTRFPDQSHRALFASLPRQERAKLVDLLPSDQVRWMLAGMAADRAQIALDQTRSPGWPAATEPPVRHSRPGLHPRGR